MFEEEVPTSSVSWSGTLTSLLNTPLRSPSDCLSRSPSPTALVEGVLLRWFILSCEYLISLNQIHAHTCYQLHVGNESPILETLSEILWNPSPISRFPSPKIRFSSHEIRFFSHKIWFTQIGFLLSSTAFRFLQQLSTFSNGFLNFFNGFLLSPTAFCFLQWLSNFTQQLSAFREIQENLFTAASIQKITIWALYFPPLAPWAS